MRKAELRGKNVFFEGGVYVRKIVGVRGVSIGCCFAQAIHSSRRSGCGCCCCCGSRIVIRVNVIESFTGLTRKGLFILTCGISGITHSYGLNRKDFLFWRAFVIMNIC